MYATSALYAWCALIRVSSLYMHTGELSRLELSNQLFD